MLGSKAQVEKQLPDAAEALAQAADPVDDLEGSADYKRHLIERIFETRICPSTVLISRHAGE